VVWGPAKVYKNHRVFTKQWKPTVSSPLGTKGRRSSLVWEEQRLILGWEAASFRRWAHECTTDATQDRARERKRLKGGIENNYFQEGGGSCPGHEEKELNSFGNYLSRGGGGVKGSGVEKGGKKFLVCEWEWRKPFGISKGGGVWGLSILGEHREGGGSQLAQMRGP